MSGDGEAAQLGLMHILIFMGFVLRVCDRNHTTTRCRKGLRASPVRFSSLAALVFASELLSTRRDKAARGR